MFTQIQKAARWAVLVVPFALFFFSSPASAQTCTYNSTQGTCACPTSGAGTSCFGGQLFRSSDNSCQTDTRPCATNQQYDCAAEACVCNTGAYPCGGCTVASSTIGAACGAPSGGQYTNICSACACPASKTLCSSSNTCVTTLTCPAGTTFDPCTNSCGTPNVLLSPSFIQSGFIQVNGDVKSTAGNLRMDSATGAGQGDTYIANGKAIRIDGAGVTSLNIGNWGAGGSSTDIYHTGNDFSTGISTMPGDSAVAANTIETGNICFGNAVNCRSSWPASTDYDAAFVNVTGDTMTGTLAVTGASSNVTAGGKVGAGTASPVNKLDVSGAAVVGASFAGVNTAPTNGLLVQGAVAIGPGALSLTNHLLDVTVAGPTTASFVTFRDNAAGNQMDFARDGITQSGSNFYLDTQTGDMDLRTVGTSKLFIQRTSSGGNVGIGTTTPAAKLDVNGGAKMTGIQLTTGAGVGKFLMSDASGNATWSTPSVVSGSGTSGQAAFWNGTSTQTGDNSFVWDNTSKQLRLGGAGYGAATLDVRSNAIYPAIIQGFNTGSGLIVYTETAGTNDLHGALSIGRTTSGTAAAGLGTGVTFSLEDAGGSLYGSTGGMYNLWTDASVANRTSALSFWTMQSGNNTSEKMRLMGNGSLGIGNTSPTAKLQVTNGSALFDGTTGAIPATGAGTRLMWYPAKGAFRAGTASSTAWDDANIGANSFAGGYDAQASGSYSAALGIGANAYGYGAVALGEYSSAGGEAAVGLGRSSSASGFASVAGGYANSASGAYATAFGYGSTASGTMSFAAGQGNATNAAALALGQYTDATGINSGAFGSFTTASGFRSYVIGTGFDGVSKLVNNIGYSTMIGGGSNLPTMTVTGGAAVGATGSVGIATTAPAAKLDVEGGGVIFGTSGSSSNTRTLTILNGGTAQVNFGSYPGTWSPALQIQGVDTSRYVWLSALHTDSGANARLVTGGTGFDIYPGNTQAATFTTAGNVGIGTTAPTQRLEINGNLRFSPANPTISADSWIAFPGGAYFNSGTVYAEAAIQARGGVSDDTASSLEIIGGTSGYTTFDGPIGVNGRAVNSTYGVSAQGTYGGDFYSSVYGSRTIAGYYYYGTYSTGTTMAGDFYGGSSYKTTYLDYGHDGVWSNGWITGHADNGYDIHMGGDAAGGDIEFGSATAGVHSVAMYNNADGGRMDLYAGNYYNYSSIRFKDEVKTIPDALDMVNKLRGVTFRWKEDAPSADKGKEDVGLIAEEVQKVFPLAVKLGQDGKAEDIAYTKFIPILLQAVKEQQTEIDDLKQQIQDIKQRLGQ